MPTLAELRQKARERAQRLKAVRYLIVQDLAARWGVHDDAVLGIPRAHLPYIPFGKAGQRRYHPKDVETFEARAKTGEFDLPRPDEPTTSSP